MSKEEIDAKIAAKQAELDAIAAEREKFEQEIAAKAKKAKDKEEKEKAEKEATIADLDAQIVQKQADFERYKAECAAKMKADPHWYRIFGQK